MFFQPALQKGTIGIMKKILFAALAATALILALVFGAAAADFVYYENDFSDASTLADFKQFRGEWEIVDGQLMLTGVGGLQMDAQAFLLFTKDEGAINLTDYIIDVDMLNIQSQAGPLFRCDLSKADNSSNNSFFGYQAFISFTAEKGALGRGDLAGDWAGNLKVGENVMSPGQNIHLHVVVSGENIDYTISDADTGAQLWTTSITNNEWAFGTFGFRACIMHNGMMNLGMLGFDNLKITATGKCGDHLAAGKALKDFKPGVESAAIMPKITPAIKVDTPAVEKVDASKLDMTKTSYVFYENDFSDAKSLADFTQYRGDWAIKDGKLYYSALTDGFKESANFSFVLYTKNHDANLLTDYTMELDVYNSQSAAGPITHADLSRACSDTGNAFYGYLSFISNNGLKCAIGSCNEEGAWGGNINVSDDVLTVGGNYHLVVEHKDGMLTYTATDIDTKQEMYTYTAPATAWMNGSFGIRSISTRDVLSNLNTVGFDNMKVTVYGEQAVLLNAGYHPNAEIVGGSLPKETEAEATEAVVTTAIETDENGEIVTDESGNPVIITEEPAETVEATEAAAKVTEEAKAPSESNAAESAAPADGNAPAKTGESGGANVGAIIGIAAAVVAAIVAAVVIILKKKKK